MALSTTAPQTERLSLAALLRAIGIWLVEQTVAERERWPLWLPVGFGLGIATYFSLRLEPSPLVGLVGLLLGVSLWLAARRRHMRSRLLVTALAVTSLALSAGFTAIQLRSAQVAAPVLLRTLDFAEVTGTVARVQHQANATRLVLADLQIEGLPANRTPDRVRIRMGRQAAAAVETGDRVTVDARLLPPPGPVAPRAFDFQRRAWFDRIGAVGFSFGAPKRIDAANPVPLLRTMNTDLAQLRKTVSERVRAALPGSSGAIAVALITGQRGTIPPDILTAVREAGLAHLLAISGLHIGLVAGFVFLVVRGGLALVPAIALNCPLKKIAAGLALLAAIFYMFLAGASVPTQRAVIMTGIVLIAVLVDRTAISLRTVAWAAVVVLLIRPEALSGASFQMSFAAVVGLVAAYEALGGHFRLSYGRRSVIGRSFLYLGGVALTTVIATVATAPFVIFHFNQLATYGLLANLVAVPLTAIWVMPLGVLALLAMLVGLESPLLQLMGWGIDVIVATAETTSAWPGAVQRFPRLPVWGLAAATIGGLWLCLMQRNWRWLGALGIAVAASSVFAAPIPAILVERDGNLVAVRSPDGSYMFSTRSRERFTRDAWLRQAGETKQLAFPEPSRTAGNMRCDALGCITVTGAHQAAIIFEPAALDEDCNSADLLIAPKLFIPPTCNRPDILIDRGDLLDGGAHAVYLADSAVHAISANEQRGRRPWVPHRSR